MFKLTLLPSASLRFPTLEHCSTGGEALLPEEHEQWRQQTGLSLHELYGQSETVGGQAPGPLGCAGPLGLGGCRSYGVSGSAPLSAQRCSEPAGGSRAQSCFASSQLTEDRSRLKTHRGTTMLRTDGPSLRKGSKDICPCACDDQLRDPGGGGSGGPLHQHGDHRQEGLPTPPSVPSQVAACRGRGSRLRSSLGG